MARQLYRSATKFINQTLALLNTNTETPFLSIRDQVAEDAQEHEAIEKTLKVLAMQGYITQTGEGENATYRLSNDGAAFRDQLGGA